eukprot:CAMPEP_0114636138 /NCGR_PEP_ID=MMETSP0168-20121206/16836_1 /TAXON_ID=95228 ORGANISM="Vannella sp., Strain DIVA3 517/6/12" /NCGR_SAMPLE_ID=MMETSP0168 /ASSEMBLY_ACC=CAM_ASM_000044 /LENGTH=787 /DNA_ID=CAMNT_0001847851 /DNA_START=1 /DNA_END=2366 /DNA_ORIENTATION=-
MKCLACGKKVKAGLVCTACKSVVHKKCTKAVYLRSKEERQHWVLLTVTKDGWTRGQLGPTVGTLSGRQTALFASQSVGAVAGEHVRDSALQVTLENALMDALRLQTRITLSEIDCGSTLQQCTQLVNQRNALFEERFQLQKSISHLSAKMKASSQKRRESGGAMRQNVGGFLNTINNTTHSLCATQVSHLEQIYTALVQQEQIKMPFLYDKVSQGGAGLGVKLDVNDGGLIERINAFRAVIRRLECVLRIKTSLRAEQQFLEKDIKLMQESIGSLVSLKQKMEELHEHSIAVSKKSIQCTSTLQAVSDTLLQLQELFSTEPVIVSGKVNPNVLQALAKAEELANEMPEVDNETSNEFDTWTTSGFGDKTEIQFVGGEDIHAHPTPEVKAATLPKLVELLTYENYPDTKYAKAFLLTYRSFMTPVELLERLILRYCLSPPETMPIAEAKGVKGTRQVPVRLRVLNVIKYWVDQHYDLDFKDPNMTKLFHDFLSNTIAKTGNQMFAESIGRLLEKKQLHAEEDPMPVLVGNPPQSSIPHIVTLFHIDPVEIARQLTLIDQALYKKLQAVEFMKQAWSKRDKRTRAPNICAISDRFNAVSNWVVHDICTKRSLSERVQTIQKFIIIATQCSQLNNFQSALALVAGLMNTAVYRMKKSWETVGKDSFMVLKDLSSLMDKSFKTYRVRLASATPPCIPYIGLWQTDLTFLDDGNPEFIEGLVNFKKMRKLADTIMLIQQYQNDWYCLTPVESVQKYLLDLPALDEQEAYDRSTDVEPRDVTAHAQCEWMEEN